MTDNEIIKALECCRDCNCKECPCYSKETDGCKEIDEQDILDLINRLQAKVDFLREQRDIYMQDATGFLKEIDRQRAEIERLKKGWKADVIETSNIKAAAIKEFAERLRSKAKKITTTYITDTSIQEQETGWIEISLKEFDNLVKEMVGDAE